MIHPIDIAVASEFRIGPRISNEDPMCNALLEEVESQTPYEGDVSGRKFDGNSTAKITFY